MPHSLINNGTVNGNIHGSLNEGAGSSGGDTITNSGRVGGEIHAGSGNDTVTLKGGDLQVLSLPQALYYDGFSWTLIQAGAEVSGVFGNQPDQPGSQTLSLNLVHDDDSVALEVSRASIAQFAYSAGGRSRRPAYALAAGGV